MRIWIFQSGFRVFWVEEEIHNWVELAELFVEEGLFGSFGDIPHHYIDFEAIGRELSVDCGEATVAGRPVFYRCA